MADAKQSRKTTASERRRIAATRRGAGGAKESAAKESAAKESAAKESAARKSDAGKSGAKKLAGKSAAKKPGAGKRVESVDGGRYVLIDGRRWRATDPGIPEAERVRLVGELMSARRDVGRALRANDAEAEREARARVHAAKVALGERGEKWWEKKAAAKQRQQRVTGKP